ncbi:uncharacterized protein [Argopecten irradians]|uniref:uncharacterized protein n=1 Tax=Argopecten irradians TaxID=31199 RepID=UPI00371987E3
MINHPESNEKYEMTSLKTGKDAQERKFGRSMTETDEPALITAKLPSSVILGNGRKLTSANTPDSVNRFGDVTPYWHSLDLRLGTRRPPNIKDDNFPPGYNGILNMDLRRRSAEMAVKLNLHQRDFPQRQTSHNTGTDQTKQKELTETGDALKEKRKTKNGRQKKRRETKTEKIEKAEISVFIEDREPLTPGLFAKGKPAPAVYRENRQPERKPEVVNDGQKACADYDLKKHTGATRDAGVNKLLTEVDRKNEEFEAFRKNDIFSRRFDGDKVTMDTSLEDIDLATQKKDVLPPINGNAVSLGRRKNKINIMVNQTNWHKIESKETPLRQGNAMKLPPINTPTKVEKSSLFGVNIVKVRGQTLPENLFMNDNKKAKGQAIPDNHFMNDNEFWHRTEVPARNSAAMALPLRHSSQPTLPPVLNVKLPPITGLPVKRATDGKKRKSKRLG